MNTGAGIAGSSPIRVAMIFASRSGDESTPFRATYAAYPYAVRITMSR